MTARGILGLLVLVALSGCEPESFDAKPPRPEWVISTHVAFYEADGKTRREPPKVKLRLWMPYVVGDIYGSPNEGEITPVELQPDLGFTLNLNVNYKKLDRILVPTQFSQKWMSIEPKTARVARVSP